MRIALIIYGSLDIVTGGYIYDRKLVEYLRNSGDQVDVVSLRRPHLPCLTEDLSSSLLDRFEQLHIDVVLQDELCYASLCSVNRQLSPAYPIVSIVHNLQSLCEPQETKRAARAAIEAEYLRTVNAFVFASGTARKEAERLVGRKPHVVGPPGANRLQTAITDDEIAERCLEEGPLRMIFLANVTQGKGLHVLLDALGRLPKACYEVRVAGDSSMDTGYFNRVRQRVDREGLSGQVSFLGLLREEELATELRRDQVLVVPSYYEGFGMAYMEGMGFGLPAIASNAGGTGEIITHGENGFLVEPADDEALAGYLSVLCNDRSLLLAMSRRARSWHRRQPGWERTGELIADFLETLI